MAKRNIRLSCKCKPHAYDYNWRSHHRNLKDEEKSNCNE